MRREKDEGEATDTTVLSAVMYRSGAESSTALSAF